MSQKVIHTPGPWRVAHPPHGDRYEIRGGKDDRRILKEPSSPTENTPEDMRLIATAPELLEALQGLMARMNALESVIDTGSGGQIAAARAAIAKATGGDQ